MPYTLLCLYCTLITTNPVRHADINSDHPFLIQEDVDDIHAHESRTIPKKDLKNDEMCNTLFAHRQYDIDNDLCIYTEIAADESILLNSNWQRFYIFDTFRFIRTGSTMLVADFDVLYSWSGDRIRRNDESRIARMCDALGCISMSDRDRNVVAAQLYGYVHGFYDDLICDIVGFMVSVHVMAYDRNRSG